MKGMSAEGLEGAWKRYETGRAGLPEGLKSRVWEFIQDEMAGKAVKEREAAAACFYAYLRGCLEEDRWRTPGEWEAAYGRKLESGNLVWIRWKGSETWKPARWGEAQMFSVRVLEVVVGRGPASPPRPGRKQLKAERKQTGAGERRP
jgi:hypothetical protein